MKHFSFADTDFNIELPQSAVCALEIIENNDGEAWIVGGYVRNALIDHIAYTTDIDIACSLPPEQTMALFTSYEWHVKPTGIKHGTITVIEPKSKDAFEITTYRSDGPYNDNRHPQKVTYSQTIEEDMARRDFTINAIAYHPSRGLCDPYHGIDDIYAQMIRCVGDPRKRFSEDALRILRALRFSSCLGYSIEDTTAQAIHELYPAIDSLSSERVFHEMNLLIQGPYAARVLTEYRDILAQVIPEFRACFDFDQHTKYHHLDVFSHIMSTLDHMEVIGHNNDHYSSVGKWAALLHDIAKPTTYKLDENANGHFFGHGIAGAEMAKRIMTSLHAPNNVIRDVVTLTHYHDSVVQPVSKSIRRILNKLGGDVELVRILFYLQKADSLAHAPEYRSRAEQAQILLVELNRILEAQEPFSVKDLVINGTDIIELGAAPGPIIGKTLEHCFEAVLDNELPNERDALLIYARDCLIHEQ